MTLAEWIDMGIRNKWISPPVCGMHESVPHTQEEYDELDEGYDPCFTIIRLFADEEEFDSARKASPQTWGVSDMVL